MRIKRVWYKLRVRQQVCNFFKTWARYLLLASLALLGLIVEGYLRDIPKDPELNLIAAGIAAVAVLGALLLRRSKWHAGYRKLVSRIIAWSFVTIGFILLDFPRNLLPFFSPSMSTLQNLALGFGIAMELTLVGIVFRMGDVERESEDVMEAQSRKRDSTPDWDAILAVEEFA